MFQVLNASWALLLGIFMLMIGNGLQGTLLGLRGEVEGFSTTEMSIIISAYFLGFLFASRMAPRMIQRVGHVRVFAAMGSTISAILILYPTLADPWAWSIGRVIIGFCFCGVYITAESWLNDSATNETRGKALSLYMIMQMGGIVAGQYVVALGDVAGFVLFVIPSVLVSLAFAPILLSVRPAPAFEVAKPLTVRELIKISPLACMGMLALGGVFAAQFGMTAVYGVKVGMTVPQISIMISTIYIAALLLQYPVGLISDRMDRRWLIAILSLIGGAGAFIGVLTDSYWFVVIAAVAAGGTSNPLYALLIAYCNDYLSREDMAGASGGLLFINGVGAIVGPLIVGYVMDNIGPNGYWAYISFLLFGLGVYAIWRMTQRSTPNLESEDQSNMAPVMMQTATPVAVEVAQEVWGQAEEDEQP